MKIKLDNVSYSVAGKQILNNISFTLDENCVLAILGENGSGKSTLIEIISGLLKPTNGFISFDNERASYDKKNVGILLDNVSASLFPWLKVKEVINYIRSIYKLSKDILPQFNYLNITSLKNSLMSKLSKGEKKRVAILLTTMHNPSLLILDEPTSELDPTIRTLIWKNTFISSKRTILFTTQYTGPLL